MGPLHEEGDIIITDTEIAEILNIIILVLFLPQRIFNNVPEFNMSYRKKLAAPMTYFRINELVINKSFRNLKLSVSRGR